MNKRKFNIKKEYKEAFNYLRNLNIFFKISIGFFIFSFFAGLFFPLPDFFVQKILLFIEDILTKTEGLSLFGLIKFIFFNNVQSSFFSMFFGIFFGIFTIFTIFSNGFLLGFVSNLSIQEAGVFSLWRILPHGIFELPAMIIAFSLGIHLGFLSFKKSFSKDFKKHFLSSLKAFIFVVIPLLIFAAVIEGILIFLKV